MRDTLFILVIFYEELSGLWIEAFLWVQFYHFGEVYGRWLLSSIIFKRLNIIYAHFHSLKYIDASLLYIIFDIATQWIKYQAQTCYHVSRR